MTVIVRMRLIAQCEQRRQDRSQLKRATISAIFQTSSVTPAAIAGCVRRVGEAHAGPSEVVVREVQGYGSGQVFDLAAERIGEPREAAHPRLSPMVAGRSEARGCPELARPRSFRGWCFPLFNPVPELRVWDARPVCGLAVRGGWLVRDRTVLLWRHGRLLLLFAHMS